MTRTELTAQAFAQAQRLANETGRPHLAMRGIHTEDPIDEEGPWVFGPIDEIPSENFLELGVETGQILVVTPQGLYGGLSTVEVARQSKTDQLARIERLGGQR